MKNKTVISKSETLEDIVFEGRNKSYGAYELNKKHRKYLFLAFFISLFGVSTAIAVPFLNSFKNQIHRIVLDGGVSVELIPVKTEKSTVPPPPPPPPILPEIEKRVAYNIPVIVDDPVSDMPFATIDDLKANMKNAPVDIPFEPVKEEPVGIDEDPEAIIFFPEEQASFMGGDINEFRTWVLKNIKYPPFAIENRIFGKVVVEFCVNSKGEVVDINFLRKLDPSLDNEALKVISSSPLWTPAKQGGRPVKQRFVIPVIFRME
jgi:protein TonB